MSNKYKVSSHILNFPENSCLPNLYGFQDQNLKIIEKELQIEISYRGNFIEIFGNYDSFIIAKKILNTLYTRINEGEDITLADVDGEIKMYQNLENKSVNINKKNRSIQTPRRKIFARSPNQEDYFDLLENKDLVFALGPAGTGKTYIAVAIAVSSLLKGEVGKIILSRPAVEAGERLGFLPGDLKDKVDPYLRPLYDALYDMLPDENVFKRLDNGQIEIAPLAFMRGRTLSNAFIIIDEAQNTTPMQMKMLLTRFGENSRMVITGDLSQVDLGVGQVSGLKEASKILKDVEGIGFLNFTNKDVVRNRLVSKMVEAYEKYEKK